MKNRNHMALHPLFTLVELLITVAIIMLLAALLLPSLGRAKEKARNIICMGNQRQIGAAFVMYAGDNKEYLSLKNNVWTVNYYTPVNSTSAGWGQKIGPMAGYLNRISVFACPGAERYPEGNGFKPNKTQFWNSYECRDVGAPDYIPPWGSSYFKLGTLIRNKRFLISCMFSQGNYPGSGLWLHNPGGHNVLYADCHVKWYPDPAHDIFYHANPSYMNQYFYPHGKFEAKW